MNLAREIQRRLCGYYGLDAVPDVADFVAVRPDAERERVLILEQEDGVDVRVELPASSLAPEPTLDAMCQLVEGISHFVLIAERARCELPVTHLELELQAEVDKFLVLGLMPEPLPPIDRAQLRRRLFDEARFCDAEGTERGERYRTASRAAVRFIHRLELAYLRFGRLRELRIELSRFFRAGQTAKLELAQAA